jgi:hypothetical protein
MAAGPIFVVGAPRTGTTLTRDILNNHPDVYLFNEIHFFEQVWDARAQIGDLSDSASRARGLGRLASWVSTVGDDRAVLDVLTEPELAKRLEREGGGYPGFLLALLKTRAEMEGAGRFGDSSPQDVLYIARILDWFPDARIVGVVRDPRGFLASYKNQWRRAVAGDRERYNPVMTALLWRSYMRALLDAKTGVGAEAIAVVRYEDLVDSPEREVRRLCEHVGVDYRAAMIDVKRSNTSYDTAVAALQKGGIDARSRDRWRTELTPTEIWVGERIFGPVMERLGYDRVGPGLARPSPAELARIVALLPGRLLNQVRSGQKRLTLAKVRRVFGSLR